MYVKGTVEEDIYSMGVRKMELSDAVLSNSKVRSSAVYRQATIKLSSS